jgi:elongation factor Ts
MNIELEQIKELRDKTGAGILDCKNALIETGGDSSKALLFLRKKGLISADKKRSRSTTQGVIASYIHTGSKIGVLLELNCETDFVARKSEFQALARNLAMQIAASDTIQYVDIKDVPEEIRAFETKLEFDREDLKTKAINAHESIVKGRVEKTLKNLTLLSQPYFRDPSLSVEEHIKSHISLFGENIQVKRFSKFIVGEINK